MLRQKGDPAEKKIARPESETRKYLFTDKFYAIYIHCLIEFNMAEIKISLLLFTMC